MRAKTCPPRLGYHLGTRGALSPTGPVPPAYHHPHGTRRHPATARTYFLAKIANGKVPEVVVGGPFDGLRYFPVVIDENQPTQRLTDTSRVLAWIGLLPPRSSNPGNGASIKPGAFHSGA
jgi:hypothetical protein